MNAIHYFMLILFSTACLMLFAIDFQYPPLTDYVEWMYQSYILRFLLENHESTLYYLKDYPVPYALAQISLALLDKILGTERAGLVLIAGYFLAGVLLSIAFVNRYSLDVRITLPILLSVILCNSPFWNGYINYQLGLLVLMAYLALPERQQLSAKITFTFGVLSFFTHGFALVGFSIIAASKTLHDGKNTFLKFAVSMIPSGILTVWYFLARDPDVGPIVESMAPYLSWKFFLYKLYTLTKAGPYHNFIVGQEGDFERHILLFSIGVLTNILFTVVVGVLIILFVRNVLRNNSTADLLAVSAFLIGIVFAPAWGFSLANPAERILYPMLLWIFAATLKSNVIRSRPVVLLLPVLVYGLLSVSLLSLVVAARPIEYSARSSAWGDDNQLVRRLYWHRPFQFNERYVELIDASRNRREPNRPLAFNTSLLGNL